MYSIFVWKNVFEYFSLNNWSTRNSINFWNIFEKNDLKSNLLGMKSERSSDFFFLNTKFVFLMSVMVIFFFLSDESNKESIYFMNLGETIFRRKTVRKNNSTFILRKKTIQKKNVMAETMISFILRYTRKVFYIIYPTRRVYRVVL